MLVLSEVYDPRGDHASDPLCWPFQASTSDLEGLPPHVIEVDEDRSGPRRGHRLLPQASAAGVHAVGRVLLGLPHAGDVFFGSEAPQVVEASIGSIAGFARSLKEQPPPPPPALWGGSRAAWLRSKPPSPTVQARTRTTAEYAGTGE